MSTATRWLDAAVNHPSTRTLAPWSRRRRVALVQALAGAADPTTGTSAWTSTRLVDAVSWYDRRAASSPRTLARHLRRLRRAGLVTVLTTVRDDGHQVVRVALIEPPQNP
ncbi:hypothetical protein V5D56_00025 (plasmid) [Cellulosimicrobium sp. PMB13]|uniref:hypothetical protein n=1 Tax=Cellulosimicrobium sp. PMB13 TaxID=3120158 RepID=UPI003F4B717B